MKEFKNLGLSESTLSVLEKKGFREPTEIQALAIPILLEGRKDMIAQAQTGTGKTAVFALPLLEKLDPEKEEIQAIVIAPTRELVIQVTEEIESLRGTRRIDTVPIYGGQYIEVQLKKLRKRPAMVVGTPGRVLDLIRRGTLKLDRIRYFILDEADEMLNMGFIEDIEEIMEQTPKEKRVLLFSATMPDRIKKLSERYMGEYVHVRSEPKLTGDLTEQIYFQVGQRDKLEALVRVLEIESDFYGIVFCRTKVEVDELTSKLVDRGLRADNLHGDLSQTLREKILGKFRNKKISILVATDVAARGIDVEGLTHVVNYSIPGDPGSYVHRIGRTGRAGKKGTAITFVTPAELRKMKFIQKFIRTDIPRKELPEKHEMVGIRRKRVESELDRILEGNDTEGYRKWARELMRDSTGEELVRALLRYSFGSDLEEGPPDEKKEVGRSDNAKTARLFLAMGKKDRMNETKVREMISHKAGNSAEKIVNIEVHRDFTYVTVPSKEAKSILKFFRRSFKGKQPLMVRAKEDGKQGPAKAKHPLKGKKKKNRPHRP